VPLTVGVTEKDVVPVSPSISKAVDLYPLLEAVLVVN
jgi:hypothetical protein